ncbi:tRNA nucleotidyltransferase [Acanthamoeba castellanii str. Neff]|uniref:tRNA nucleotidyltransferase n=1 Tax=Acanthamoeba castellanii (strain ATCC 30010 / Neff) TaxID=1257118 RepID=L8GII9_ACACF|nr:tRNA nucleotidyltransferase [Acanthamoeba castellanii str. Neff]ELR12807.1 tRNA nucleotidyltransferase [Acanthamoeba castellanii str. Neff]
MLGQDEDRSSENLVDEEEAQIAKRRRVLLRNLALLRPASSAATPEGVSYDASQAVELSDKEREVFTFLLAVNESFGLKSTLRVAGGWVRDKLRGEPSYDIDIALDNMMGKVFAERVNEYLAMKGYETHNIGVIQSNPEQSKHLETATMRVFDVWLDFVNLREESYSEHSRIPSEMTIGTPTDDAYRRDLTINSLFYNINENTVEDWTKSGLTDLADGIIRTPLPAETTFMDDPLRILRAIRFASRLEFALHADIIAAAAQPRVRVALGSKISRERIGKEVEGMLSGPHPELAFYYIHHLGLYDVVWALPPPPKGATEPTDHVLVPDYRERAVNNVRQMKRLLCHECPIMHDKVARRRLFLAASLKVYSGVLYMEKKRAFPVTHYIIKESLRWKVKDMDEVLLLHNGIEEFHILINKTYGCAVDRKDAGLLMRRLGALWKECLYLAVINDLPPFTTTPTARDQSDNILPLEDESVKLTLAKLHEFCHKVEKELHLDGVWDLKPLINGQELMQLLGLPPGPAIRQHLEREMAWQLSHPDGTLEECAAFLRQAHNAT